MRCVSVGLVSGVVLSASLAVAQAPVELEYTVSLGPVDLADFRAELLDLDGVQSVQVQFASRGVAAWWSEAEGSLEVLTLPNQMRTLSGFGQWGDYSSQVDVLWPSAEQVPQVELVRSRPPRSPLSPVPEESTVGTVDPFAPVFLLSQQLGDGQPCVGFFQIYDGIRRYNVTVAEGATREIQDSLPFYSGTVRTCEIAVERIGGFSERRGVFRFGEGEISRRLYFGELNGRWWPVRFEIDSPLGEAVARLRVAPRAETVAQTD